MLKFGLKTCLETRKKYTSFEQNEFNYCKLLPITPPLFFYRPIYFKTKKDKFQLLAPLTIYNKLPSS